MTEAEARALSAQITQAHPMLICELRPRIHTGSDETAPDLEDAWSIVVTNSGTGVVVNVTRRDVWEDQLSPALNDLT
ncbi:MAG TPA: hypothetical protein VLA19_04720 [Herpetosiphonaceae bacterium]|nr:hypothetical protein [Herpetosiphonaceae bacterium]